MTPAAKRRRVYCHLEGTRSLGSSRIRGFDLADRLTADADVHVKGGWDRIRPDAALWRADTLYFQKTTQLSDYVWSKLARAGRARRLAFDIDDAKHVSNREPQTLNRTLARQQDRMLRTADVVTVASTDFQAFCAERARDVRLARTPVDLANYRPRAYAADGTLNDPAPADNRLTVGWLGNGNAYDEDLKLVAGPLTALADEYPLRVRIVGALGNATVHATFRALEHHGIDVDIIDAIDWAKRGATGEAIRTFDVGVYPLRDLAFNRNKGGFKLLEYMASGVPAVVSPVSETAHIVQEGAPALVARNTGEWTDGLDRLLASAALRAKLGNEGRAYATAHHGFDAFYAIMRDAILGD